jgi:tRNA (guanine37-N1)-methyltransferase
LNEHGKILREAVKVPRCKAEELRRKLIVMGALDRALKPFEENGFVFFPLKKAEGARRLLEELGGELTQALFEMRARKPRSLKEHLAGKLPNSILDKLPSSYDIVGDLILVDLDEDLRNYAREIGEALLRLHPRTRMVLTKGETIGDYRIRNIEVIAGSGSTETIYREHGCVYKLDLRKVFFNPRLSGERLRVARQVAAGERVLDMFAGVGPFSILIAKLQPSARIVAVEINPDAYKYLLENLRLNRVEDRVKPILGDARKVLENSREEYDRVIMDLPYRSLEFLDVGLRACKNRGIVHLYTVSRSLEEASRAMVDRVAELKHVVEIEFSREVMEVAPRRSIFALDLRKVE